MKILLTSATSLEIKPLIQMLGEGERLNSKAVRYHYRGNKIDVLTTGVGMVATSFWLGDAFARAHYDLAINVGVCGAFDRDLKITQVVQIIQDEFPEMGAEDGENFLSLIDLDLLEEDDFPFSRGVIEHPEPMTDGPLAELTQVRAVTVNKVHGNEVTIEATQQRVQPQVESMEGAAFMYACRVGRLNFAQIRSVSNYVERRNRDNWELQGAVRTLNETLLNYLNQLG